ncbi:hypothetical protein [Streptomyces sp. NPDC002553]|uniref:hypothetical protein n=1 Tax=Streptomyces sp. NPDC002553 TaxID=3154417 RepID=UPI0033177D89
MGALRRMRAGRPGTRTAAVAGLALVAVGGLAACDPGGLSAASVAYTTDEAATAELARRKTDVQWLTCTADYGKGRTSAGEETVASVKCQGRTDDGRDIEVDGTVTRAVDGSCVRGDLRAQVGGRQVFRVSGLGDCASATPSPLQPPPSANPGRPARPTVTVTVTRTIWCPSDTRCGPVEGK